MERLSDLFFELSHEDRLTILMNLQSSPFKLTKLSREIGASSQEVYRHLSRLLDAGLVSKTVDGEYTLTRYGEQVLLMVPGYGFLTRYKEHFMTRDLSVVPEVFTERIGELTGYELTGDVMVTLFDVEQMIRDAEEYIWLMTDQMVMNLYAPLNEAAERGVRIHVVRPRGWRLSEHVRQRLDPETFNAALRSIEHGSIIQRELEVVPVFLNLSEKKVSSLSFQNQEGKLDYLSFTSTDPRAHRWCKELFTYCWDRAEKAPVRSRGTR